MKNIKNILKQIESDFTVFISKLEPNEDMKNELGLSNKPTPNIELASFDNKSDANKHKRHLIKKYKLSSHGGHIVNYDTFIELTTNY